MMEPLLELLAVLGIMGYGFLLIVGGGPKLANRMYAGMFRWIMRHLGRGLSRLSSSLFKWMGRAISWILFQIWRFVRVMVGGSGRFLRSLWRRSWRGYRSARARWPYGTGIVFGGTVFAGITASILFIVFH